MARYEIRFGRSPSANFATAVRLAETVDGHRFERGEHVVPIGQRQLPVVERLIALVAGWRCTSFVIDGMLVSRGQLYMLLRVIECHRERRLSGLEELYCWGLPGPRRGALPCRLVELSMPIVPGADYGNRQLLRRLMTAHARGVMADACPAFDGRALQAAAADFIGPGASGSGRATTPESIAPRSRPQPRRGAHAVSRLQLSSGQTITVVRRGDMLRLELSASTLVLTRDEVWRLSELLDRLATEEG